MVSFVLLLAGNFWAMAGGPQYLKSIIALLSTRSVRTLVSERVAPAPVLTPIQNLSISVSTDPS